MEMSHVQRELPVSEQDTVIYLKQKLLLVYAAYCVVAFPCLIGLWVFAWHQASAFVPSGPVDVGIGVGLEILTFAFLPLIITAFGWFSWLGIRPLFSRLPALVISHEGVLVGKLPWIVGDLFIPWEQIRSIYLRDGQRSQYLCVLLKETDRYLSRLSRLKQFGLRFNTINGAIINLPVSQLSLERPVREVVQMVSDTYTHELDEYRVELRP